MQSVIIPEELRRILVPPTRGAKTVLVEIDDPLTSVVDLIETLLWFSPQAEGLCISREQVNRCVLVYTNTMLYFFKFFIN